MAGENFKVVGDLRNRLMRTSGKSIRVFAMLNGLIGLVSGACADQPLACRQLSPVAGTPTPTYSAGTADVQLIIGDHYWACPCGEARRLVGDSEQRKLVGDGEQRKLVGDSEQRKLVGDSEQRKLVGDGEQRKLVGDSEQRKLVGDSEQRKLVGDAGGLQCRHEPNCTGFVLMGANISGIKVVARDGIRLTQPSCVMPY